MDITVRPPVAVANRQNEYLNPENNQCVDEQTAESIFTNEKKEKYNEIYAHESAHLRTAGSQASGGIHIINGDNGVAESGFVMINSPTVVDKTNPQKTYAQAKIARDAALAPGCNLSNEDLSVASKSATIMSEASGMKAPQPKTANQNGKKLNIQA